MKKYGLCLIIYMLIRMSVLSQNLVPNPGFESNTGCPGTSCQFDLVTSWFVPNNGTGCGNGTLGSPDYFNTCGSGFFAPPNTLNGNVNPNSGNGMAGIATYVSFATNFREYISVQLDSALASGKTYQVTLAFTNGTFAQGLSYGGLGTQLGVHLSSGPLVQNGRSSIILTPTFESNGPLFSSTWQTIQFTVTPPISLDHLTIGNFRNDRNTTTQLLGTPSSASFPYAFYFMDNVVVEEMPPLSFEAEPNDTQVLDSKRMATQVYPNHV